MRNELAEKASIGKSPWYYDNYLDGFDAGYALGLKQAENKILELELALADRSEKYGLFIESGLDQKCREVKKLKEASKGLLKALEFYADLDSWKSSVSGDYIIDRIRYDDLETKHYNMSNPSVGGKKARQALKEFKEKTGVE